MEASPEKLNELSRKVESLLNKQESYLKEIYALKAEINRLKHAEPEVILETSETPITPVTPPEEKKTLADFIPKKPKADAPPVVFESRPVKKGKSDIERFIGENLISKLGIVITVIGVGVGAKYAIDHQLVSPLTRIILGYLVGIGLFLFSMRLRKNYENFSAVLLSGAMAILYFITYAAYAFYGLIPQPITFFLMFLFTVFTVVASLSYNQQIIALLGMVGAYAVPFLLSNESGRIDILFSYIAIINGGVLFISFRKYWKMLFYSGFILTWVIFTGWYGSQYSSDTHFGIATIFLSIFFLMFYATFLSYKLVKHKQFEIQDIIVLLANSFIFYGLGYLLLEDHLIGEQLLGAFTLVNAIIHFAVARVLIQRKLADQNLVSFVIGLVLVFVTISIPVQLDGNWVTLIWVLQATLLFWIGRTRAASIYEKLSYPLMLLAAGSLIQDWVQITNFYQPSIPESNVTVFFNIQFLTSLLCIAAFGFINYIHQNKNVSSSLKDKRWFPLIDLGLPVIFLSTIFFTFRIEIMLYWDQLFIDSGMVTRGSTNFDDVPNFDLQRFQTVWLINFSIFFFLVLSYVNIKKLKNEVLGSSVLVLSALTILTFLVQELLVLSQLRDSYLNQSPNAYFETGAINLWIRYVGIGLVGGLFWLANQHVRQEFIKVNVKIPFVIFFYTSLLWILSSELINWMDIAGSNQSYKLGLSILWGVYALVMVVIGIWKGRKFMRVAAIVLLGVTLVKLFLYDIAELDTIAKTIVLVSLGILLLIVSFLYNKYKGFITNESQE